MHGVRAPCPGQTVGLFGSLAPPNMTENRERMGPMGFMCQIPLVS
jgi:hypothetical protein